MTEPIAEPRPLRWTPNTPIRSFVVIATIDATASDVTLYDPQGRTAATDNGELDEWSDENIRRWLGRDRLDPELDEWVSATLGE